MGVDELSGKELKEKVRDVQKELQERLKELQCLYDMATLISESGNDPDALLEGMPEILCRSWQYPEVTCARILFRDREYRSDRYAPLPWKMTQDLVFLGEKAGFVEVGYLEKMPLEDEGPFLQEERALLDAVAERLSHVLERWDSERQLEESRAMFKRIADNAQDMIYRMSLPDGRYEFVNQAAEEVFGYPPQTFYDKPALIREVIHPDFQEYLAEEWDKLLAGDMSPAYEYKVVDKDGGERWLHQRNVLVRDNAGRPVAIEGIVTDITQRKELIEQLEAAKEGLDRKVRERTAELEREMQEGRRREEVIAQQNAEILELSTPALKIADRIVAVPLIGTLDSQRTQRFAEVLLEKIVATHSEVAIIDITGVPQIDTQTAQHLMDTVTAVRLLGCEVVLTGVRASIAQTVVHLGMDLSGIRTVTHLAQGLKEAVAMVESQAEAG